MPAPPDLAGAPTGGTLTGGGAIFRAWAPRATAVHVAGDFNSWQRNADGLLTAIGGGHWAGFVPGLAEGDQYLFHVEGPGSSGFKRDPRARELTFQPAFPGANCVLRNPARFPWHETEFRPPAFNDLIIYQLHVGAFSPAAGNPHGRFLDIAERLPYLAALGVNAIEPLPIVEYPTTFSLGYNGTDYFSPENDYGEVDEARLQRYFESVNGLLRQLGQPAYGGIDVLRGSGNQLRALVDLCHLFGIAVIFDVVYNHAGGGFDPSSLAFFDRMPEGNWNDSLYFTAQDFAGGQVFAYHDPGVRQFLIDNARFFVEEYRIDGYRFDEVSAMDRYGGWQTCQDLTSTLRHQKPEAIQIAEYWPVNGAVVEAAAAGGAGFDATWHDGIRSTVRAALTQSSAGAAVAVDLTSVAVAIAGSGLPDRWRAVQCVEDHDEVRAGRAPRIPRLADPSNARSWYARSRSRVALGLVLTAPGIPMLFMGEEILEDKPWDDTPAPGNQIWWAGLESGDKAMADYLRFCRELIALRRRQPALRGEGCSIIQVHDADRVLAFQRWVPGRGLTVVVVASLHETTYYDYPIALPGPGRWLEVFNSDVYDNWVNPLVAGNGGSIEAAGGPLHDLPSSAAITIPANGLLVFARQWAEQ
jgi:1,4-alpha-glucan branching enzyme